MGNWEPNTPPPAALPNGNWAPNTPPATAAPMGNWEPNTPPPTGNWEPNTPPPAGNWEPNTPPVGTDNSVPVVPAQPMPAGPTPGVWVPGRVITHLWSSSAYPGVWAWIAGLGWKRLAASETGRGALTTLAVLAKANGLPVSYHENSYGQIDQILA
jgi:hypothetical protein